MSAYLVRNIRDHGILGVFWGSCSDVWVTVDEVADPILYEMAKLNPAAIYNVDRFEPKWDPDSDEERDFASYVPSQALSLDMMRVSKLKWRRLGRYKVY